MLVVFLFLLFHTIAASGMPPRWGPPTFSLSPNLIFCWQQAPAKAPSLHDCLIVSFAGEDRRVVTAPQPPLETIQDLPVAEQCHEREASCYTSRPTTQRCRSALYCSIKTSRYSLVRGAPPSVVTEAGGKGCIRAACRGGNLTNRPIIAGEEVAIPALRVEPIQPL